MICIEPLTCCGFSPMIATNRPLTTTGLISICGGIFHPVLIRII